MTSEVSSEPGRQAPVTDHDSSPLQKMMWFGMLQLAGMVAAWAASLYLFGSTFSHLAALGTANNTTSAQTATALGPVFRSLSLVIPISGAVQIVALAILAVGFWELKKVDRRFSVPSIMVIVAIIGGALAVVGLIPFFGSIANIIAQGPTASAPGPSAALASALASLIVSFILLAVGCLLTLIGFLGGQLLGLWRAGNRYNETLLKVGAIFAIFPFLNLIAPVLVIVGANQSKNRLRAASG